MTLRASVSGPYSQFEGSGSSGAGIEDTSVRPFRRLRPDAGLHFVDFTVPVQGLSSVQYRFIEESGSDGEPVLIALTEKPHGDGIEWHPITHEPLTPGDTLWITGFQALEYFAGRWLPLPYLRIMQRRDPAQGRFDDGPWNWARLFITPPTGSVRDAGAVQAVLAFDPAVAPHGRLDQDFYLTPNQDDVTLGATYDLATGLGETAPFLAEPWVAQWLDDHAAEVSAADKPGMTKHGAGGEGAFRLASTARYLALLKVLGACPSLPQIRFTSSDARRNAPPQPARLFVDIDDRDTAAILVSDQTTPLRLRDLGQPSTSHESPWPTQAEFAPANFGNATASRLSGRLDAFQWPSLVRVGEEARRYALRPSAVNGVTGLRGLRSMLNDTAAHPTAWRFSREETTTIRPGPIVSGGTLNHLTETGGVIDASAGAAVPAVRPRFSASSMLSMFASEIILHALSQLNAEEPSGPARALAEVVVSCPAVSDDAERRALTQTFKAAIDLIWTAYGWNSNARL
ncbi:MAG: virulence factor SrfB, partial [Hyphomicrobiaceae bacterium]|nr:virulence factor SrfB [Hyphomicrobiaceae bacterium]